MRYIRGCLQPTKRLNFLMNPPKMAIFREILVKSSEFRPVFSPYFPPKSFYLTPNAAFEDYPVSSIDPWQSPVDSPWS